MSVSNIQQNYIQYNSNNSSPYIIQQSYPNNAPSQPVIVSNNYNNGYQSTMVNSTQYQAYSVPQPQPQPQTQQISNGSYQNTGVNNQIISTPENNNTFIKVQNPYDNVNRITTTQQEQVYPMAPTNQPVQQIYNGQGYVRQSPTVISQSNIAYQQPQPQQQQSHIIINNSNEIQYSLATSTNSVTNTIYSSSVNQDVNQSVITAVTQSGISPVVLKQSTDSSNSSEGVLPLFQKQPQQQVNYTNSSVISNSPLESNNENSNANSKNTCIYTPLQTPNTSPIKKDVVVNDNGVNAQPNKMNNIYPATTLAQGKNISPVSEIIPQKDVQTNGNNINNAQYVNTENSINSIASNNEMLSPKSLSNDSSNQSVASANKMPIQNSNNNNIVVVNNIISPEIKEVERKMNGNQDQYLIQGQNQGQNQIPQASYNQPANNNQNSAIQNIPYQSPDNNYVVSTENNNVSYNTYNSYNNVVSQPVINQQYNIQQQGYYNSQPQQNQTFEYQQVPIQGKPVQFLSPPTNVSYIQNPVVQPMENNNVSYNSPQQIVNNQVNYQSQQMNSNQQQIYYNGQPQVQQVQQPVSNMNMNPNYNTQFSVPYPVRPNNVISANSPPAKVKRYKCSECGKRFSRPSSLKTHMYSHTGQHPFKCTLAGCGRRFSVLSNLRRHMKVCQKRHEKNRALILRNAKLSNSKICDDDEVNTTTITIDDINSSKVRVIENKKAKNAANKAATPTSSASDSAIENKTN